MTHINELTTFPSSRLPSRKTTVEGKGMEKLVGKEDRIKFHSDELQNHKKYFQHKVYHSKN